jgi:peptidyl-prolyl cis-trans isomerase C
MKLRPLLPLALVLGCSGPARPSLPETIGFVDGEAVTVREYLAALELDERENEGLSPRSAEELRVARRALLDGLVDRKLLAQAARRRGIRVEEADVERAFLRLRADWPGESFDKLLADTQLTVSDLQARLRDRLIVEKLFAEEDVENVVLLERVQRRAVAGRRPKQRLVEELLLDAHVPAERELELRELLARISAGRARRLVEKPPHLLVVLVQRLVDPVALRHVGPSLASVQRLIPGEAAD